jgi:hypothetical protein
MKAVKSGDKCQEAKAFHPPYRRRKCLSSKALKICIYKVNVSLISPLYSPFMPGGNHQEARDLLLFVV